MAETPVAPPPSTTVTLKIDGRDVTVPKGTNILEAAKAHGVTVPYFCYHPGLSSPAVCRQCLVEVKGQPKLVPSCYTPVADAMEVTTNSTKAVDARQQMLEFTLVNHPVDCPICDKAGECTLQKNYFDWDRGASRVDLEKRHKPKVKDLGPTIVLDAERCILCTRCVRVCDEVAHNHQLEMAHRGDREQIDVAPGKQLDNPYSLNTVDVCPVGALTSKDFRFEMRVWELTSVDSVCTGCATGCNTELHYAQGRVERIVPRENQAVNKFWMCDAGRMEYHALSQGRVADLNKKIDELAERLTKLSTASGGWSSVGVVLSARATNEDNFALVKLARTLGISKVYRSGRPANPALADDILRDADQNPNSAGVLAIAPETKDKTETALASDIKSGSLKALLILGDAVTLDDETIDQIARLDTVAYFTWHKDALSERAHFVIPTAAWAECDGTFTNRKNMVQRIRRAFDGPGDARPAHELIIRLGAKLSASLTFTNVRTLFTEMKSQVPSFADATFGKEKLPLSLRFAGSRG